MQYYGDPVLREVCEPVDTFDDELRVFAELMIETMREEQGIGLAAPQVGSKTRVIVALQMKDVDDIDAEPLVLVNPRVVSKARETWTFDEGCLSIPGISAPVIRPKEIEVEYQSLDGEKKTLTDDFIFGRILLHEIDHLNGVLFVDYLSSAQKSLIKSRLKKLSNSKHLF
jgi:peptide deformylase